MSIFWFCKNKCISEKDYLTSIKVWNGFKMNTISDYHDLI